MTNLNPILVAEYSGEWPLIFDGLRTVFNKYLSNLIVDIQHVGSTSVPGLAAKPTIDIDLVIESRAALDAVIAKLDELGYEYQGDLGIRDREAFRRKYDQVPLDGSGRIWPKHHLYCCTQDSLSLKNHLQFRDYLRKHPEKVKQYSNLKRQIALQHPFDANRYTELKTPFITEVLREADFDAAQLDDIANQNKLNG